MKGFNSGMRRDRVTIRNRKEVDDGKFGRDSSGVTWEDAGEVWASVEWQRGKAAMSAGALDSYGVVMVRMNWNCQVSMRSRIVYEGQVYQILPETFHADYRANQVQFLAQAIINEK